MPSFKYLTIPIIYSSDRGNRGRLALSCKRTRLCLLELTDGAKGENIGVAYLVTLPVAVLKSFSVGCRKVGEVFAMLFNYTSPCEKMRERSIPACLCAWRMSVLKCNLCGGNKLSKRKAKILLQE